jgi:hypothetical protein
MDLPMICAALTAAISGIAPLIRPIARQSRAPILFRCYDNGLLSDIMPPQQTRLATNQRIMPQRHFGTMGHNVAARTLAGLGKSRFADGPDISRPISQ